VPVEVRRKDIVNIDGGAIANGQIGATGAVFTKKLVHSMGRDGLTRGLVTLCIGERYRAGDRSSALNDITAGYSVTCRESNRCVGSAEPLSDQGNLAP
jgi:hypothetical protein